MLKYDKPAEENKSQYRSLKSKKNILSFRKKNVESKEKHQKIRNEEKSKKSQKNKDELGKDKSKKNIKEKKINKSDKKKQKLN